MQPIKLGLGLCVTQTIDEVSQPYLRLNMWHMTGHGLLAGGLLMVTDVGKTGGLTGGWTWKEKVKETLINHSLKDVTINCWDVICIECLNWG